MHSKPDATLIRLDRAYVNIWLHLLDALNSRCYKTQKALPSYKKVASVRCTAWRVLNVILIQYPLRSTTPLHQLNSSCAFARLHLCDALQLAYDPYTRRKPRTCMCCICPMHSMPVATLDLHSCSSLESVASVRCTQNQLLQSWPQQK